MKADATASRLTALQGIRADYRFLCDLSGVEVPRLWLLRALVHPSVVAGFYFRLAATGGGGLRLFAVWMNLLLFGCYVGRNAVIEGPLNLPHPTGIVVGEGSVIGPRARLFQHVTLGRAATAEYPVLGADVWVFTGATVVGAVRLAPGTRVAAHALVTPPKND